MGQTRAYGGLELQHTASSATQQNRPHTPRARLQERGLHSTQRRHFLLTCTQDFVFFFHTVYREEFSSLIKIVLHLTHMKTCMQNETCTDRHAHTHTQAYNLKDHNSSHIIPLFIPPREECRVKTRKHFLQSQQI